MRKITFNLNREYFDQVKTGEKTEEYREVKPHWTNLLEGKNFDEVHICLGFPPKDDHAKRLVFPWRGYSIKENFIHPVFGNKPTTVYAIKLGGAGMSKPTGKPKLTPVQVRFIRSSELSLSKVAQILNISKTTAGKVRRWETYKDVV